MIDVLKVPILQQNLSNLRELSKDDSASEEGRYMSDSMHKAVNFDMVKRTYANNIGLSEEVAASVDALALLTKEKRLTFIEFKNGDMKNQKRNVKDKIRDSLLMFCDITNKNLTELRTSLDFILVYNEQKNALPNQITKEQDTLHSLHEIGRHFAKMGGTEFVLFGLERFKKLYFHDVHTFTRKQFAQYLEC